MSVVGVGRRTVAAAWVGASALAFLLAVPLDAAWRRAPDLGHGWAAPLLIVYLWWERWDERPGLSPTKPSSILCVLAAGAAAAALPLRLLLTPFPLWPALVWAYVLLLVAVALTAAALLSGRAGVRWLGGPLIILAAALPWAYQLQQHIIYPLREGMAAITAEVSNALGRPAIAAGTSVHLASGWLGVDEACGGIRSLEASVMLALFFGEWLRLSWKRRGVLVATSVFAALLGNFLRIVFLSLRAGSDAAAFVAAHDVAGWAALTFSLALTGLMARVWSRGLSSSKARTIRPPATPRGTTGQSAAAWLLMIASLLVLNEAGTRWWYARGSAARALLPQWTVRFPTQAPGFKSAPLGEEARELLAPDRYGAGSWQIGADATASAYYIEWRKGQAARFVPFLHNPTVCLPLAGCEFQESLGTMTVRAAGLEMPFSAYLFRRSGKPLAVAFLVWDTSRGAPLDKSADTRGWFGFVQSRWEEVREAREDQPAQMISLAVSGPNGGARLAKLLESLIFRP